MSNYEYGKTYNPYGEKPDLPDEVRVWFENYVSMFNSEANVGEINWGHVSKFRIVDKNYKPTPLDQARSLRKKAAGLGWNPEVGDIVLYENTTVEVIARDQKLPQVCVRHNDGQLSVLQIAWLRPQSERETLIISLASVIEEICKSARYEIGGNNQAAKEILEFLEGCGYTHPTCSERASTP